MSADQSSQSSNPKALLKRSLAHIKQLRAQVDDLKYRQREPIAVVGMACRFPGAPTVDAFWDLLIEGRSAIGEVPADRWDLEAYFHADPDRAGKMYTRKAGFLDRIDLFDAGFFGISPREAAALDPQQRLALEVAWEALEDAAYPFANLRGSATGVYLGITSQDYGQLQFQHNRERLDIHNLTGTLSSFAAGRLSYVFGLEGPSMAIDTSCSSSLVALHTACAGLRNGECETAISGGVNAILLPDWNIVLSRARMMAPDGFCKTFDRAADGYVRGEGCGMVILKTLSRAKADGDRIRGLILGSALNSDGRSGGLTVPSGKAQAAVIRQSLRQGEVEPSSVSFIESHGTGTSLGDPIEIHALGEVYGQDRDSPLYVGAVKTNIGHLEPAAGIAGFLKTLLMLERRQIPPNLHFRRVNPELNLDRWRFEVPTSPLPWNQDGKARGGLSSFGASGTNAHLVVGGYVAEQAETVPADVPAVHVCLPLSAKTGAALNELVMGYRHLLTTTGDLPSVAATAARGRAHFTQRLALTGREPAELIEAIDAWRMGEVHSHAFTGGDESVPTSGTVFLFTGQGSVWPGMAADLYRDEPQCRHVIDQCADILADNVKDWPVSLVDLLTSPEHGALLERTRYAQPALFAMQMALVGYWRAAGVEPEAVIGHSLGEFAAACAAGVFDLETGLLLVADRGALMDDCPGQGGMTAVFTNAEELAQLPGRDQWVVAAVNGATHHVVSGSVEVLERLHAHLDTAGIRYRALAVSHAFHSAQMDPCLSDFEARLTSVAFQPPTLPLASNRDGRFHAMDQPMDGAYWIGHLRETVQFAAGLDTLWQNGYRRFVEIGPAPVLTGMARRELPDEPSLWIASQTQQVAGSAALANGLAALYTAGIDIDWAQILPAKRFPVQNLPHYPFQRRRFWQAYPLAPIQSDNDQTQPGDPTGHPLLGSQQAVPGETIQFETRLDGRRLAFLRDFRIHHHEVVNIGVMVELALAAVIHVLDARTEHVRFELSGMEIMRPLLFEEAQSPPLRVTLNRADRGVRFDLYSLERGAWSRHAGCLILVAPETQGETDVPEPPALQPEQTEALFSDMAKRGIDLGPGGRWFTAIGGGYPEAWTAFRPADSHENKHRFHIQPGVIDAICQLIYAGFPDDVPATAALMLMGWESLSVRISSEPVKLGRIRVEPERSGSDHVTADADLWDSSHRSVVKLTGIQLKSVPDSAFQARSTGTSPLTRMAAHLLDSGSATRSVAKADELAAMSRQVRTVALRELLCNIVAPILGTAAGDVDMQLSLHELGMDSLMALELKGRLDQWLNRATPLSDLLSGESLAALADTLCERLGGLGDEPETKTEAAVAELPGSEQANAASAAGPFVAQSGGLPKLEPDIAGRYKPFELTDMQQAYLVGRGDQFELGDVPTFFTLEVDIADLDVVKLNRAWNRLIVRHDMLRAVFTKDGRQRVLPEAPEYAMVLTDVRGLHGPSRQMVLDRIQTALRNTVLSASRFPLFSIRLTRLDDRRTRLHFGMDALIVDAWSTMILFREWAALYQDSGHVLANLDLQFRDYVQTLQQVKGSKLYQRAMDYWKERLSSLPPAPALPVINNEAALRAPVFNNRSDRMAPDLWREFKRRAASRHLTPSIAVCCAYAEVLAAWSKSRQFTLDLLFFNRLPVHANVKRLVANFSSTLLLAFDGRGRVPFAEQARKLQRQLTRDLDYSLVSGVEVLREYHRFHGGSARAAMPVVFASTLNLHAPGAEESPLNLVQELIGMGTDGEQVDSTIRTPQVWLDHQAMEDAGGFIFNWAVVEDLFPDGMVTAMFDAYRGLLMRLAADDAAWDAVARPGLVAPAELAARDQANQTQGPGFENCLHDGFVHQARTRPDRVLIVDHRDGGLPRSLSYGFVLRESLSLADRLRKSGVRPDHCVGVLLEKSWRQVQAVLAVHLAGGAYLPASPAWPAARCRQLWTDARVEWVITTAEDDPDGERTAETQSILPGPPGGGDVTLPPALARPENLAYVIYTSGSTGKPKGVAMQHAATGNTLADINRRFTVTERDRVLALTALTFDLSVYDIFGIAAAGGSLVLPAAGQTKEPAHWQDLVHRERVTVWNTVPALMDLLVTRSVREPLPDSLRLIMMSGDWIPLSLPPAIRAQLPTAAVISLGGATEAAVWSNFHPIDALDPAWPSVPYGKPLTNQRFHILDEQLAPCPTWVPGHLFIAGDGLAREYFNHPGLTADRFIPHPATGERLYRTGDLARYHPDGVMEFLGRDDFQVKIQGFRVELGEIEAVLDQHPAVSRAVTVTYQSEAGGVSLAAFYVPSGEADEGQQAAELTAYLAERLPDYMIPRIFQTLPHLPLTANGKVDRNALPQPEGSQPAGDGESVQAPRNRLERILAEMWCELLSLTEVGIHENFFHLGGHSFTAMRLMAWIAERFDLDLPLSTLLHAGTIAGLAEALSQNAPATTGLVPLRQSADGSTCFLVHPVGGNVLCYRQLADELGTGTVIGLPASGLQDGEPVLDRIETMAETYIHRIRQIQPHGPYHLAGWSLGGVVAYEIARQLIAADEPVALTALIDSVVPDAAVPGEASLFRAFMTDALRLSGEGGSGTPLPAPTVEPVDVRGVIAAWQRQGLLDAGLQPADFLRPWRIYRAGIHALHRYRPAPFKGARLLVISASQSGDAAASPWLALAGEGARHHGLDGDHYNILLPPRVSRLAAQLRLALDPTFDSTSEQTVSNTIEGESP